MRLIGKIAIITGGATGMGAAEAKLFASEGAHVVVGDILVEEGEELVRDITEAGGSASFVRLDVTCEEEWKQVVKLMTDHLGRIDILVNNAGIYDLATIENQSLDSWNRVMAINATGMFLGTKAVISVMRYSGAGSIVNISSVAGLVGSSRSTAYNASKGAVRLLTKATAVQYAKVGIRANSVHPGPIETDMLSLAFPENENRMQRMAQIPLGRFGTSRDVASAVLFLASDESSYMTGTELVIDGGSTAQ